MPQGTWQCGADQPAITRLGDYLLKETSMAGNYEDKLAHVGEAIDEARNDGKDRFEHLADRLEQSLEHLRAELDDLRVQASLGKLEARDATAGVVETLRNRSLDARTALTELRAELRGNADIL